LILYDDPEYREPYGLLSSGYWCPGSQTRARNEQGRHGIGFRGNLNDFMPIDDGQSLATHDLVLREIGDNPVISTPFLISLAFFTFLELFSLSLDKSTFAYSILCWERDVIF